MNRPDGGAGRLFLAVGLPDGTRRALETHLRGAVGTRGLPGRPVLPANWHLTLRFLGDAARTTAERLREELRGARLGNRFDLAFDRLGAFPKPRRAGVLWLGVGRGADALRAVAAAVEAAVVRAGLPAEDRAFRAHLTLSRIQPAADLFALVEAVPPFGAGMLVETVTLYRSHLGGGPPRYEVVEAFPLTRG